MSHSFSEHTQISASHPSLPGHFPGHPLVPAVVLLESVESAALRWLADSSPRCRVEEIVQAKFLAPLPPGQAFDIALSKNGDLIHFECRSADTLFARGSLRLSVDASQGIPG